MWQIERNMMITSGVLLRRGATLLGEACPRCGGVQIRYEGRVYCLNEDDIESALTAKQVKIDAKEVKPVPTTDASNTLRKMLEDKLAAVSKQLESTTDIEEQSKLLDLVSKYVETLQKLNKATP